ncbi:hypothetical protein THAR02_11092 [Trichoderma harzianum]|uniref:Uncharacterized protein n=1 Tax=Trichoderma harzianum TaxID=5544 RepID=A0A0F9X7K6_TRIHA|nr:hypothetical protein THAR02_11092 [Trichoderma harzianum]
MKVTVEAAFKDAVTVTVKAKVKSAAEVNVAAQAAIQTRKSRSSDAKSITVIDDDDLVTCDVIARCCFIRNGVDKATSRKSNKDCPRDWERLKDELRGKKNADGKTIVSAYYLGFSMDMKRPAFMRHQTPKIPKGETRVPGRVPDQISENNLGGLVIKSEPASTITGRAIIPHYLMTVKENLLAAKRLVSGVPLEDALIRNLENGKALDPPALITPHEPQGVRAGTSVSGLFLADPNAYPGKRLSDVVCRTRLLTRSTEEEAPAEYKFCLPPIEALEFPPELLCIPDDFIKLYPGDLIDRRVALIGCFIFQDIIDHTEMQMEKYFQIKKAAKEPYQAVPEENLAATIIYTPHFLRWPESIALKKWVQGDGEQFSSIFSRGTSTLIEIRKQSVRAGMPLAIGACIAPVAKYKALTNEQFAFAEQHLDEPIDPDRPIGPDNPRWRGLVCDGAIQRRGTGGIAGFQYSVSYLTALVIPEQLTAELHQFTLQFPNDLFTPESLLFRVFACFDCKYRRSRTGEVSTGEVRKGSKRKSLA